MNANEIVADQNGGYSEIQEKIFNFWNGDEYFGQFAILGDKQKLVMEGRGLYKTAGNEIYEGMWENDELKEAKRIVYKDTSEFSGTLDDMRIEGFGKYKFKENVEIEGDFRNNTIRGQMFLTDPNSHLWKKESETDAETDFILLTPMHAFWQSVLSLPHKSNFFNESAEEDAYELFDAVSLQ